MLTGVAVVRVRVEIGVVGQVNRAGPIDLRLPVNRQAVVIVETIFDLCDKVARIALIAVRRVDAVEYAVLALADNLPATAIEPFRPAVQLMRPRFAVSAILASLSRALAMRLA